MLPRMKTLYTVVRDRGLLKLNTPMCPNRRPFQSYLFVPWTLFTGELLTQLPAIDLTYVKVNRLARRQIYQQ